MSETDTVSRPALPDPVVDHPIWREALGQVQAALSRPYPIVAVLGPPGTGKTLLLRDLLGKLRAAGRDAVLLARGDAEGGPAPRGVPGSPPGVVLVDEADRIDPATLRVLTEAGARGIVLAALPNFAERLDAVPGAAIVMLHPLGPDAAVSFLRARLAAAGTSDRLTGDALAGIVATGAGVPRLLCGLLAAAEFVASLQGAAVVTAEHVQEAVLLRGHFGANADAEAAPNAVAAPPPTESEEKSVEVMRGPTPGERWAESVGTIAPAPVRRRAGLWAVLACAAIAALFVAYAARQPLGEPLGRQLVALLQAHPAASPATADLTLSASATPPLAVEVASNQAAPVTSAASSQVPADPAPGQVSPISGLPRGVVPHVVLSYRQGDVEAERRAVEVARTLRTAGFAANDPVPVLQRIAEPGITYFFAEDQAGAAELSRALDGAFGEGRAVTLRQDEPLPRPGTIELQISSARAETAEQAR